MYVLIFFRASYHENFTADQRMHQAQWYHICPCEMNQDLKLR